MDAGQNNYVDSLNQYAQRKGWAVHFVVVETAGPDHIKTFTMKAVINGKEYPDGVGRNKKEAKQNAAKNALNSLEDAEPENTDSDLNSSASLPPLTQPNYICWLNEYSQKNRLYLKSYETSKMSLGSNTQMGSYVCKFVCGDKEYPEVTGNSKKEAKEAAAKLIYDILAGQEKQQVFDENGNGEENPIIQGLSTSLHSLNLSTAADTVNTTPNKNFIGLLNEHCQRSKQVNNFKAVGRKGPAHDPEFVFRVVIGQKEYPEGRGKSATEAKQKAAQLALSQLYDSDSSSQISSPSSMSESTDNVSLSQKISKTSSKSESIVFTNSSPVPPPQPPDVKPKRQLAANFQNSPLSTKKQPNVNVAKIAKPSTQTSTVSNSPAKSRFLEEFDSITKIGKGANGSVYKARRKLEKKTFAVKIVKLKEKALREVTALSHLDHVNIVRYHTSWTEETAYGKEASETDSSSSSGSGFEFLYIQMEFCEGETVFKWIQERNKHPEKYPKRRQEVATMIKQVLEAVKYIHSEGCIHRDLKPANIMLQPEGEVKVGDFGLVTKEERDNDGGLLERTMDTGTPSYMSPEQRTAIYDRKVDIYALGLIYFELLWLFGTKAERAWHWNDIRSRKFPEGFPQKFDFENKQIERMLCENPERRPEARDLLTELDQDSVATASTERSFKKNRTY